MVVTVAGCRTVDDGGCDSDDGGCDDGNSGRGRGWDSDNDEDAIVMKVVTFVVVNFCDKVIVVVVVVVMAMLMVGIVSQVVKAVVVIVVMVLYWNSYTICANHRELSPIHYLTLQPS